jgi:hypothetical protein
MKNIKVILLNRDNKIVRGTLLGVKPESSNQSKPDSEKVICSKALGKPL